jgi:hypothetical protein
VKAPFPGFVEPALATSIEKVPSGNRWVHEVKFDGYRVQVHLVNEAVKIFTRRGHTTKRESSTFGAYSGPNPVSAISRFDPDRTLRWSAPCISPVAAGSGRVCEALWSAQSERG